MVEVKNDQDRQSGLYHIQLLHGLLYYWTGSPCLLTVKEDKSTFATSEKKYNVVLEIINEPISQQVWYCWGPKQQCWCCTWQLWPNLKTSLAILSCGRPNWLWTNFTTNLVLVRSTTTLLMLYMTVAAKPQDMGLEILIRGRPNL